MSESTSFVRLFVGFLLSVAGVHTSCPIELSPPSVVVKHGGPVAINCSTLESLYEGLGWEATQGGIGLKKVQHLTWTVESLTEWSISPSCYITPLNDSSFEQCAMDPKVVLYTFPENISISSNGRPGGVMAEKKEYNLTCEIKNIAPVQNLTVTWYKGDAILRTDTFNNTSKEPVDQSSVLSFTPTRQDNGVTFRCEAHLDLGPEGPQLNVSSQEYNITVYFGPHMECPLLELLEGESLEKKCHVIGNPTPSVKWLKDGQPINANVPLDRKDAGNYTIEAEGYSSIRNTFLVRVLYGPQLTCPSIYTAVEDSPHNLNCTVEGYPKPNMTWYKDGEEEELPEILTRSNAGQYMVTASIDFLTVNVTVEIIVMYPPSQIAELEDSEVNVGANVYLKCSSMGYPRPTYVWSYYRTGNVDVKHDDGVSLLTISNANAYNMGSYTCHAWNDGGNVSKTARVTVKGTQPDCPIQITPSSMVIKYQSTDQNATCAPTSEGFKNIVGDVYWQANGNKTDGRSWFVDTNNDWDPRPVCTATFKRIGKCQKKLNFILYKTPDSISVRPVHDSSSVVEGKEFQLQCDITNVAPAGNLAVRWYRGDKIVSDIKTSMQVNGWLAPVNLSSAISVTLNRKQNGAEFRCESVLDLGPDGPQPPPKNTSSPLAITVSYGPELTCPGNYTAVEDTPHNLTCTVEGYPDPVMKWYKDNKEVKLPEKLTRRDTGQYLVKASNSLSTVNVTVEIIVKYGPQLTCCSNYTAVEDTPHNLTCTAEGYPDPVMKWYKDNKEVKLPEKLTRRDTGQYMVTASEDLSIVNVTVEITVMYPPSQIADLEDSEVDVGANVTLKCSSIGYPQPTYIWSYTPTDNVRVKYDNGVSLLIIHNADAYHVGSYTCHASNNRGNVSKTARVTVKGATRKCPIAITPSSMVIKYQSRGQNATCAPTLEGSINIVGDVYWQANGINKTDSRSWFVDTNKDWDPRPVCTATFKRIGKCQKHLNFTLYKTPDSISVHPVHNSSSVVEGKVFQLQCDITNVAPARNLAVQWYRGDEIIVPLASMRVTGCLFPVNVSSTISVTLNRKQNGAEFRCEAVLDLGPDGPQPPPKNMSSPLTINVCYKPIINTTKLPKTIPVYRGYSKELVCEADGQPPPKIKWLYSPDKVTQESGDTLTVFKGGLYTCRATNEVDSSSFVVEVILKEDYLPLIAGFVAVTVIVVSIVLLFIYSIYYKNTKRRRYSLKNLQFPMTKLS